MTDFKSSREGSQPQGYKAGLLGCLLSFNLRTGVLGVQDYSPMARRPQALRSTAKNGHGQGESTAAPGKPELQAPTPTWP